MTWSCNHRPCNILSDGTLLSATWYKTNHSISFPISGNREAALLQQNRIEQPTIRSCDRAPLGSLIFEAGFIQLFIVPGSLRPGLTVLCKLVQNWWCNFVWFFRECPQNFTCLPGIGENPNHGYTNFDDFGWAMLNSFQLITLDFWEDPYNKVSS